MKEANLSDETRVPLRWVLALLVGATGSLGGFVALGVWAGSIESKAESASSRVDAVESKFEGKLDKNLESLTVP